MLVSGVPAEFHEAAARAAGLLGSDQLITHAKPFKRAKKSLGIRSVRNGFASAGEWFWLLETPAQLVANPPSQLAPPIPSNSIPPIGRLHPQRPPPGGPPPRGRQFLPDCHRFLSAGAGCWAERAAAKRWDALALFGCGLNRPLVHCGAAGLLWAIAGGRLVELHRDWAV